MTIWQALTRAVPALPAGNPFAKIAGKALARLRDPDRKARRRQVAFTIAAIALAAKMARADGFASDAEFATFQRLFQVPEAERVNAERFYQFAKSSTAGFEAYARQAAALLGPGSPVLEDLLEALMLIAATDGVVHPAEVAYLDAVAQNMGFGGPDYARIKARYITPGDGDPYVVLGVEPGASPAAIRDAYRALVKEHHPDRHLADGTPSEFIRVTEDRMAAINAAYATLMRAKIAA